MMDRQVSNTAAQVTSSPAMPTAGLLFPRGSTSSVTFYSPSNVAILTVENCQTQYFYQQCYGVLQNNASATISTTCPAVTATLGPSYYSYAMYRLLPDASASTTGFYAAMNCFIPSIAATCQVTLSLPGTTTTYSITTQFEISNVPVEYGESTLLDTPWSLCVPSTTSTSAPSTNPPKSNESGSSLSAGAKAGIGVGVAVAVLLIVAFAIMGWLRRSRQRRQQTDEMAMLSNAQGTPGGKVQRDSNSCAELGAEAERVEMPRGCEAHELPGNEATKPAPAGIEFLHELRAVKSPG